MDTSNSVINSEPEFLTPRQLAVRVNMSQKWVVKRTQERVVPGQIKIGRLWRYRRSDVEKHLKGGTFLLDKKPPDSEI